MSNAPKAYIQEHLLSEVPEELQRPVQIVLHKFIIDELKIDEARFALLAYIGDTKILDQLIEFLDVPDIPPPYASNSRISFSKKMLSWNSTEDRRLIAGIHKFGLNDWKRISDFVGTGRNRTQCSQRWSRSLNPLINKSAWTESEDYKLQKAVFNFGVKSWTKVASEVPGRTDVQCRYRYSIIERDGTNKINLDDISSDDNEQDNVEVIYKREPVKIVQKEPAKIISKGSEFLSVADLRFDNPSLFNVIE